MKRFHKSAWIGSLCLLSVLAGVLGGCVGEKVRQDELPTVIVQVFGTTTGNADQWLTERASRITEEKLGCRIAFQFVDRIDYDVELRKQRLNTSLPDIFVVEKKMDLIQMAESGDILCLDEWIKEVPFVREIPEFEWTTATQDGKCYAVPYNNTQPAQMAFVMRKDICDALGISAEEITSLEELHQVLLQVKREYPDMIPVVPHYENIAVTTEWDPVYITAEGTSAVVFPWGGAEDGRIVPITQYQPFVTWCQTMYQWRQEGLLLENSSFNQESRQVLLNMGSAFGAFTDYNMSNVLSQSVNCEYELCYALLGKPYIGNSYENQMFCISKNSADPALCVRVMELLYTDKNFLHLCIYGTESEGGEQEGNPDYFVSLWCWPNNHCLMEPEQQRLFEESRKSARVSGILGFSLSTERCKLEAATCEYIMDRYYRPLINGELNPEVSYPELERELMNAGVGVLQEEAQRQFDEWRIE